MMKPLLLVLLLFGGCRTASAQQDTAAVRDTTAVAADSVQRFRPGTALLRSLLVPGWGQFSVGAYKRGAFFAAVQGTSYYMLVKTHKKLSRAEDRLELRTNALRDSLIATDDTVGLEAKLDTAQVLESGRALVDSRERQMQDWITYTLFFTLASGVDAFVAAHLADFPVRIEPEAQADGSVNLRFSVPFPSRRQR
jgi:hypothetical protein